MNKTNLKTTVSNIKEKAEQTYDDIKEETSNKIKNKTQKFLKEGKKQLGSLERYATQYEQAFISKVREKPLTSLALAAGIGFLAAGAGFLLSKFLK